MRQGAKISALEGEVMVYDLRLRNVQPGFPKDPLLLRMMNNQE